ncbi:Na+/H+ antiporter NhaA [Pelagibacteraceae bacterium]|nr:Na+/H+ antiporter NhaA [Pelagibacteraceae bacterium]
MINYITTPFKWFFKLEAASGLLLLIAALIALALSNSMLSEEYFNILNTHVKIGLKNFNLDLSILHWINDALMAVFFFVVTLEIKREFLHGELSKPKQALLPIIGAVGGMAVPALIYVFININEYGTLRGWAIPSATDIAFSIGVLSLLGSRVPVSLKVFLMALAIIDDLGAIVIIALFYSNDLHYLYLTMMFVSVVFLIILNKFGIKKFIPYLSIGLFLWFFTYGSGIHSTISGVLLALMIPHRKNEKDFSLLLKLEHLLSPYVAYGIMPLFALANAGVSMNGFTIDTLLYPVPLGILSGLFFGKQLGVFIFSYLAVKLNIAEMPSNSNWIKFYGVGILTGIGFTMSLFVGNLAFQNDMQYMEGVKIGVLFGSLLSSLVGYFLLLIVTQKK